ncbi:MAG: hypothetical protein NC099_00240 [Corallococcus sp.]|nr:hypothetical protein [Bacillota bacterium]MCM1533063.1 hypothetical protein [Corallococcus sp.]
MLSFMDGSVINKTALMWVAIVAVVLAVIALLVKIIMTARHAKAVKNSGENNGEEKKVTPQSVEDSAEEEQVYLEVNERGYIVIPRNVMQSVGIDGKIREGRYKLESAEKNSGKFNVRVNGLVKEYSDGDELVLTDRDTVCPVSGAILIKRIEE